MATGVSMMILSLIIYLNRSLIFFTGILLIAAHNLLDKIHIPGSGIAAFAWTLLHEPGYFTFGDFSFSVRYPVLPWIGVMSIGYIVGRLYVPTFDPKKRRRILLLSGCIVIMLFLILRIGNLYGDGSHWAIQKYPVFSLLSFLNVTKYPPSLLYLLMTLGTGTYFSFFFRKAVKFFDFESRDNRQGADVLLPGAYFFYTHPCHFWCGCIRVSLVEHDTNNKSKQFSAIKGLWI